MEAVGTFSEGECNALNGLFSSEEVHLMAQLLGNYPAMSSEQEEQGLGYGVPSTYLSGPDEPTNDMIMGFNENAYSCSDTVNSSSYYFHQGSCLLENYQLSNYNSNAALLMNNSSMSKDSFLVGEQQNNSLPDEVLPKDAMEGMNSDGVLAKTDGVPGKKLHAKTKTRKAQEDAAIEDQNNNIGSENPKKKSRVSGIVQGNKKNALSKKRQKLTQLNSDDEETNNAYMNGQSSSSYRSEDDTNASQELNGGAETSSSKGSEALNLSRRTRARRGSATDPQSLYARKRRERINERLRILQNLVPNGTKVDISTMLEEAVQFVKFLQLQIKLLSSDDLWMYAPIAYNGMNIGLDLKITSSL